MAATIAQIYGELTDGMTRFVRVEQLVQRAAEGFPGLVPTESELAAEAVLKLKDKQGLEISQSLLVAAILAHPECGTHLCHAMLLPRPETDEALAVLAAQGFVDLGRVRVERHGRAAHLVSSNPRYLNAED